MWVSGRVLPRIPPNQKPGGYQRGLYRSGDAKFERFSDRFLERYVETFHGWCELNIAESTPYTSGKMNGWNLKNSGPPERKMNIKIAKPSFFSGSIVNLPRCKLSGFEFLSNPSVKKRRVDVPIIPSARIPHTGCQKIQVLGRGSKHLLNFHPLLLGGDGIQLDGCIFFKRVRKNHQVCNVFFWTWGTVKHKKDKSLVVQFSGCRIDYWIGNTFQALVIF